MMMMMTVHAVARHILVSSSVIIIFF